MSHWQQNVASTRQCIRRQKQAHTGFIFDSPEIEISMKRNVKTGNKTKFTQNVTRKGHVLFILRSYLSGNAMWIETGHAGCSNVDCYLEVYRLDHVRCVS
jgi:hypothetical protein